MARVEVTIPTMLATLVKGPRRFEVEGDSVAGVLEAVFGRHPELRVHVFDESGAPREHVLCFHNEVVARDLSAAVADGDTVMILQAVSGG
jgi:molybdopterin converting factor small subunit